MIRLLSLAAVIPLLTGCLFVRYVPVDGQRPVIPVDDLQRPSAEALAGELGQLSDAAKEDLTDILDYVQALRRMVDTYNEAATAHNAGLEGSD